MRALSTEQRGTGTRPSRRIATALALAATTIAVIAAPATARDTVDVVKGTDGPGPAKYDRVFVHKLGPKSARRVLVLVPGYAGGAGDFTLLARELVKRVDDLQVWAVDRRSQAFEDTGMFERAFSGEVSKEQAFDYYLNYIFDNTVQPHYQPLDPASVPFVRDWGLKVALDDLRRVVKAARKGGSRQVILGGHSLGASDTAAYAAWDFKHRPGFEGLSGIVLIDGGLLGSFNSISSRQRAQEQLDALQGAPFADLLFGGAAPYATGLFAEVGALYAKLDPTAESPLQDFPLLPAVFNPPFDVTNRGLLGHAFDQGSSPDDLGLIHVRAGRLATSGNPRDWVDGEVTPVARLADTFAQEPSNSVEWYFPERLRIDTDAASTMKRTPAAKVLGVRLWHTRQIDLPLYAFQTDLTDGAILAGARKLVKRSKIDGGEATLVDRANSTSHLDPLTAAPKTNYFLKTVTGFLRRSFR